MLPLFYGALWTEYFALKFKRTSHILTLKVEEKRGPALMEIQRIDLRFNVHQATVCTACKFLCYVVLALDWEGWPNGWRLFCGYYVGQCQLPDIYIYMRYIYIYIYDPWSDECGYKPILLQPLDEANLSACSVTDPTELVLQYQCYEHSHTADYCVQFMYSCLS